MEGLWREGLSEGEHFAMVDGGSRRELHAGIAKCMGEADGDWLLSGDDTDM